MFSPGTARHIRIVADYIADDALCFAPWPEPHEADAALIALAETTLDRLTIQNTETGREINRLVAEHGYPAVEKAAARLLKD